MTLDAWDLLYDYLGDASVLNDMTLVADYWLDHGMSDPGSLWPNLPYPYNTDVESGRYDGDMRAGKGFLQPDKAASFGAELVKLYRKTENPRYLDAAVKIADTLSARVVPGDGEHSPWPFRVNATTGKVPQHTDKGKNYLASYTSNWSPALRLFAELGALHEGHTDAYRKAADLVVEWIRRYPLKTNEWGPFFEDVGEYSDTEINADTMAAFILEDPDWGRNGPAQAQAILQWSEGRLGNHDFEKLKVVPINEQTVYPVPANSHTARHAWVELLYCEKTEDGARKQQAIRRLNWATYSVAEDGENRFPTDDVWLTDGYGDYIRHYLRAMASAPELAPKDQNHLLRSSSVIQNIRYDDRTITYRKFDARSSERLKLGKGAPVAIQGGTMHWDASTRILTVSAQARVVSVTLTPVSRSLQ